MKILVCGRTFEDSFADNVVHTLRVMGHDVVTLGHASHASHWSLPRHASRVLLDQLAGNRPTREERKIWRLAKVFRPELVLALTRGLHPEILDGLGGICRSRRILWWGDSPANNKRWGMLDPGWDAIYTKDAAAVAKLRLIGRNAHHLHEAMNPDWHRPLASQANGNIAVVGNSYAFRQAICLRLMDHRVPVAIYGPGPPIWSDSRYCEVHTRKYVVREEKSRVFGEALACLNTFQLAEDNSLNCRAFEIAGAGGLQCVEYRAAIEECFEAGRELLTFSSFDELIAHIDMARKNPTVTKTIREAGARRALAEHTYQHRLKTILRQLEAAE